MRDHIRSLIVMALLAFGWAAPGRAGEIDFDKWRQLRPGLTRADVVRIMGEPELRERRLERAWDYGVIVPEGPAFPKGLAFRVWFDQQNVVSHLESPFGQQAPRRGIPDVPHIFLPQPNVRFAHYPRLLDIRWSPVIGTYPMSYEVSAESGIVGDGGTTWFVSQTLKTSVPYASLQFGGAQPGRVRVRAINAAGTGPWSVFTVFAFAR